MSEKTEVTGIKVDGGHITENIQEVKQAIIDIMEAPGDREVVMKALEVFDNKTKVEANITNCMVSINGEPMIDPERVRVIVEEIMAVPGLLESVSFKVEDGCSLAEDPVDYSSLATAEADLPHPKGRPPSSDRKVG